MVQEQQVLIRRGRRSSRHFRRCDEAVMKAWRGRRCDEGVMKACRRRRRDEGVASKAEQEMGKEPQTRSGRVQVSNFQELLEVQSLRHRIKQTQNNHLGEKSDFKVWPGTAGEWLEAGAGDHILGERGSGGLTCCL